MTHSVPIQNKYINLAQMETGAQVMIDLTGELNPLAPSPDTTGFYLYDFHILARGFFYFSVMAS